MGLFDKIFEKKECAICGGDIGLLGNRKLEDGNMCKNCEKLLSPWFDERRKSTVEQIKQQLEYREANKEKVAAFKVTRTLGDNVKILIDEDEGNFAVTSARNLAEANPDIIPLKDITGCTFRIDEDKDEITEFKDGERRSYNPPRFKFSYNFYMTINVRHPYFDEIDFKLNGSSVDIEVQAEGTMPMGTRPTGSPVSAATVGIHGAGQRPSARPAGAVNQPGQRPSARPVGAVNQPGQRPGPRPVGTSPQQRPAAMGARPMVNTNVSVDPEKNADYRHYRDMGDEIKALLLQTRQDIRDEAAANAMPKQAVNCPSCGAPTTPDANGRCEYCGAAVI